MQLLPAPLCSRISRAAPFLSPLPSFFGYLSGLAVALTAGHGGLFYLDLFGLDGHQ